MSNAFLSLSLSVLYTLDMEDKRNDESIKIACLEIMMMFCTRSLIEHVKSGK